MRYPRLSENSVRKDILDTFYGYNHNLKIGRGEFFDQKNMTSAFFPILSPRKRRGIYATSEKLHGMIAKDNLCYVDGSKLVINSYPVEMGLSDGEKQMVSMGAYIIILPDKKYINTKDFTDHGNIEARFCSTGTVQVELSLEDGSEMEISYRQAVAPEKPHNLEYWLDDANVLKRWSESSAMWVEVPTTYVKISATGIGELFSQYDGVDIRGITGTEINGNFVIWSRDRDWIVVTGIIGSRVEITTPVTVQRTMPSMDFVIESGNRLWGCRYGLNNSGDVVNEIYASKLGDFRNWNCYMGISTDSYAASRGSDGEFTGAVSLGGHPIFFKETMLHKIYGTQPSNFQIQDVPCRGVQKGSWKSLAIVNEVLYYKSRMGVCSYDGSLPVEVSDALGEERYSDASAGSNGNLYYISMRGADGRYNLFCYDTVKRIWSKEDNTHAESFCGCKGSLYFISGGHVYTTDGTEEGHFQWMAESGVIGTEGLSGKKYVSLPGKKYVSRLLVRMAMDAGTRVQIYIQYDSMGDWELVMSHESSAMASFTMPIRPRRCDHFRLRICGEGDAKIYSICKVIEQGSDL